MTILSAPAARAGTFTVSGTKSLRSIASFLGYGGSLASSTSVRTPPSHIDRNMAHDASGGARAFQYGSVRRFRLNAIVNLRPRLAFGSGTENPTCAMLDRYMCGTVMQIPEVTLP